MSAAAKIKSNTQVIFAPVSEEEIDDHIKESGLKKTMYAHICTVMFCRKKRVLKVRSRSWSRNSPWKLRLRALSPVSTWVDSGSPSLEYVDAIATYAHGACRSFSSKATERDTKHSS